MAQIRFVHPEETTYVRVSDVYDDSSEAGAAMRTKIPPEELHGQEVGHYFPGATTSWTCPRSARPDVMLNLTRRRGRDQYAAQRRDPPRPAALPGGQRDLHPGRTLYSFRPGPDGLRFLNFRPRKDATYITRDEMQQQRTAERETR